jgi:hypothetical protein
MPATIRNSLPDGQPSELGITMLGASETGKTTFLAALQIALLRQDHLGWSLAGDNPGSTQAMIRFMHDMTQMHAFPPATVAQLEDYRWSLTAQVPGARGWRRGRLRRPATSLRIPLQLVDGPGAAADGNQIFGHGLADNLMESLAGSAAIMLFFDPLGEHERGDAFRHLYGVLTLLRSQAERQGKLRHHIAVCITKFDAIPVYRSAEALRIIARDPAEPQFPHVPEEYAEEFFTHLAKISKSDDASLILPLLRQTFYEDRIRFFVTSSIGFYVDALVGVFDPDDYQNLVPGDKDRIRGGVYPINVVEPVLWLGGIVAKAVG